MAKLIAFIDGSVYSESVCDHAAWIAGRTGAEVEVLHVLGRRELSTVPGKGNLSGSIGLGARSALLEQLAESDAQAAKLAQERGRAILADAKARIEADGVAEVGTRLRNADIVETIQEYEAGADLVVIGKRGLAADFARLHLGSNLERVVRSSTKPVLVASRAFKPIKKVLIAFDGGRSVTKAVDFIAGLQGFDGLDFRLLAVGDETDAMRQKIEAARDVLREAGHIADARIEPGQPEKIIAEMSEVGETDMLLMGAYGHSRIRNFIIGSTTTEMLRSCRIPVMLFR